MGLSNSGGLPTSGDDSEVDAPIMSEINITPLTDIFLVLLIIFMVTSSVMSQMGAEVDLPTASNAVARSQPDGVIVTLLPSGVMKVNDARVGRRNWRQFRALLTEAFEQTSSRVVILEGDRRAFLGSAIEVMDQARIAGAENFAIATASK